MTLTGPPGCPGPPATVVVPGGMLRGASPGAMVEPGCCRQEYVPVRNARRVGVQVEAGEWASVNRDPCRARRSMFGVLTSVAP